MAYECVPTDDLYCPFSQQWSSTQGKCVDPKDSQLCPFGQFWDSKTSECTDIDAAYCLHGEVYKSGRCLSEAGEGLCPVGFTAAKTGNLGTENCDNPEFTQVKVECEQGYKGACFVGVSGDWSGKCEDACKTYGGLRAYCGGSGAGACICEGLESGEDNTLANVWGNSTA